MPLQGAPFQSYLGLAHSGVTDLSPLQDSLVGIFNYDIDRVESNWGIVRNWPLKEFQSFSIHSPQNALNVKADQNTGAD